MPQVVTALVTVPLATLADRLPRKWTLMGVDGLRGIITFVMAGLLSWHCASIWDVYGANLLLSIGGELFTPAMVGVLPNLLEDADRDLAPANALMNMMGNGVGFAAYAVGGIVMAILGTNIALFVDGVSFFGSAVSFLFVPMPRSRADAGPGLARFWHDMGAGFRFIRERRGLRSLVTFAALANLVGGPTAVLTAVYAHSVLHGSTRIYGWMEAGMLSGSILGSFVAGRFATRLFLWQWVVVALTGSGGALLALPLVVNRYAAVAFVMMFTAVIAALNIPFLSAFEQLAPDDIRGRVMQTLVLLLGGITGPIGLLVGSALITYYRLPPVLLGEGSLLVMLALIGARLPVFRHDPDLARNFRTLEKNDVGGELS
ncbi:MAG: MFS transporter [Firmicutes bacterium]|nr:MFS transporter [Bacillota bacterium]